MPKAPIHKPRKKRPKARLDTLMIERGICQNAKEAFALVLAKKIIVNDQRAESVAATYDEGVSIKLRQKAFVGRGALKLKSAVEHFGLEPCFEGQTVLDIGASTGGFTEYALSLGAKKVIALDVGTNQLAWSLRQDPRVVCLEQTDIRNFTNPDGDPIDLIVCDVSFISLRTILPAMLALSQPSSILVLLIKPQFEAASALIPDGGVLTSQVLIDRTVSEVIGHMKSLNLRVSAPYPAAIRGKSGNQEFFVRCDITPSAAAQSETETKAEE